MPTTYTDQILRFAKSVDVLDDDTFSLCLQSMEKYLEGIGVIYFAAMVDGIRVNNLPALEQIWGSSEDATHYNVYNPENPDEYLGITSYTYDLARAIWITSPNQGVPISKLSPPYYDQWNACDVTAQFVDAPNDHEASARARTTVYVPLRLGRRVFGVFNFDLDRIVQCNEMRKEEIKELVEALSTIIWLRQTTVQNVKNTQDAFDRFSKQFLYTESALKETKVFLASAQDADPEVMSVIRDALAREPSLKVVYWADLRAPGVVNDQIKDEIHASSFGVCYLSELDPSYIGGVGKRFNDNSNVLFEAGMMQSSKKHRESGRAMWIAIREDESITTPAPFDIANLRLVLVPRHENGALNAEALLAEMNDVVKWIVENT